MTQAISVRPIYMRQIYLYESHCSHADLYETTSIRPTCMKQTASMLRRWFYSPLPHLESLFAIVWLASLNASSIFKRVFLVKARDCLSRSRWFPQKIHKSKEVQCTFGHIELPAKLLGYFLRSNKSNINQLIYLPRSHIRGRTSNQNVIVTIPVHRD